MKSNIQEAVEAKPTLGVLRKGESTAISVRLKGKIADLDKIKLKIYWMAIPEGRLPAGLLSESYKRIKD